MNKDAALRIWLRRTLREKFLDVCRQQDRPAAQVVRELMRNYISEHCRNDTHPWSNKQLAQKREA